MSKLVRRNRLSLGINNVLDPGAHPARRDGAKYVVQATNVDCMAGGQLKSRITHSRRLQDRKKVCDPASLIPYNGGVFGVFVVNHSSNEAEGYIPSRIEVGFAKGDTYTTLSVIDFPDPYPTGRAFIAARGLAPATVANGEVYFMQRDLTTGERHALVYDGVNVRPWAIPPPTTVSIVDYTPLPTVRDAVTRVAVTREYMGVESVPTELDAVYHAVSSVLIDVGDLGPPGSTLNVYVTEPDGSVFYFVGEYPSGYTGGVPVYTDALPTGRVLQTIGCIFPAEAQVLAQVNGVLLLADKKTLYVTRAYEPNLVDAVRGVFAFTETVTDIQAAEGSAYILAGEMYLLQGVGTDEPKLTRVEVGERAIAGSLRRVSENRVVWATALGFVYGNENGTIEYVTKGVYHINDPAPVYTSRFFRDGQEFVTFTKAPVDPQLFLTNRPRG